MLPYVNRAIQAMKRDGTMKRIERKHFGTSLTSTPVIR
jgi:ABC-type amino acid transport substrate-binding protein